MDARQFDSGFIIRITVTENAVPVSISTATTLGFTFRPPRGSDFTRTPGFFTDGSDGILEYTVQTQDLTTFGQWKVFPVLTFPGGLNVRGTAVDLIVEAAPET